MFNSWFNPPERQAPDFDRIQPADKIEIKVSQDSTGRGWWAWPVSEGEESAHHGRTITEAIDFLMEYKQEDRAAEAHEFDDEFVYEIPYSWI